MKRMNIQIYFPVCYQECDIDQSTTLFGVCQQHVEDGGGDSSGIDSHREQGFTSLHSHLEDFGNQDEELAQASKGMERYTLMTKLVY